MTSRTPSSLASGMNYDQSDWSEYDSNLVPSMCSWNARTKHASCDFQEDNRVSIVFVIHDHNAHELV